MDQHTCYTRRSKRSCVSNLCNNKDDVAISPKSLRSGVIWILLRFGSVVVCSLLHCCYEERQAGLVPECRMSTHRMHLKAIAITIFSTP